MISNAMIQMDGKLWGLKKKYPVLRELVKELGHKNQVSFIILSNLNW